MGGKQTRFFMLTALGSAVLGMVLGAAFGLGGDEGERLAAAETGRSAETIGDLSAARYFFADSAQLPPAAAAKNTAETAAQAAARGGGAEEPALPERGSSAAALQNFAAVPNETGLNEAGAGNVSGQAPQLPQQQAENGSPQAENAPMPAEPRGVLNGYKGYRHHRPGYKSGGDGWWYPRAAFSKNRAAQRLMQKPQQAADSAAQDSGKHIGAKAPAAKTRERKPAVSQAVLLRRHIAWCAAHHPSYDAAENSYRRGFGAKRPCVSPYRGKARY